MFPKRIRSEQEHHLQCVCVCRSPDKVERRWRSSVEEFEQNSERGVKTESRRERMRGTVGRQEGANGEKVPPPP